MLRPLPAIAASLVLAACERGFLPLGGRFEVGRDPMVLFVGGDAVAGGEDVVEHQHLAFGRGLVLGQLLQEHPGRPDRGDLGADDHDHPVRARLEHLGPFVHRRPAIDDDVVERRAQRFQHDLHVVLGQWCGLVGPRG